MHLGFKSTCPKQYTVHYCFGSSPDSWLRSLYKMHSLKLARFPGITLIIDIMVQIRQSVAHSTFSHRYCLNHSISKNCMCGSRKWEEYGNIIHSTSSLLPTYTHTDTLFILFIIERLSPPFSKL